MCWFSAGPAFRVAGRCRIAVCPFLWLWPGSGRADRARDQYRLRGVRFGRVWGLKAADLEAVFYGAPQKGSAAARCWPRSSPARNWPPGPGGLWLYGVTERVCRPWHPPLACGSGLAQPSLTGRAGGRVAGAGPRRPASRTVILPAQPGTASQPGTPSQLGTPSWSETLTTIGREGQMAARRTGDTGVLGAYAVREE
jgi:hypothetical protein